MSAGSAESATPDSSSLLIGLTIGRVQAALRGMSPECMALLTGLPEKANYSVSNIDVMCALLHAAEVVDEKAELRALTSQRGSGSV